MTETQTPRSEEIFGIAKKFHLELEKLPLQSHGAVVSMIGTMAQHREFSLKAERAAHEEKARADAMAAAQAAHDAQVRRTAEQAAKDAGIVLVGK